jgi:hypothetical protein
MQISWLGHRRRIRHLCAMRTAHSALRGLAETLKRRAERRQVASRRFRPLTDSEIETELGADLDGPTGSVRPAHIDHGTSPQSVLDQRVVGGPREVIHAQRRR